MWVVFKNLKQLIKNNTRFFVLIILAQTIGTFAICFSVGVLMNNHYLSTEDENTTKTLSVNFDKSLETGESYDYEYLKRKMVDIFSGDIEEIWYTYTYYKDDTIYSYVAAGKLEGTNYVYPETVNKLNIQVYEGRNLTEDDYTNKKKVALVSGIYDKKNIMIEDTEYDVVGKRQIDNEMPVVWIPITVWDTPVYFMYIHLYRIPTLNEYNRFCGLLNDIAGENNYTISQYYAGNSDTKALYTSMLIAILAIGISVVGTILVIYGYVYETRKNSLVIMKLCGCSNKQAILSYIIENFILTIGSCALGLIAFVLTRLLWLDKYYLYIKVLFDAKTYIICGFGLVPVLMIENFLLAWTKSRVSIKEQLLSARR